MARLAPLALVAALLAGSVGSAGASRSDSASATTSRAFAVQAVVPGQGTGSAAAVSAPPDVVGVGGSFAFPADGSVVRAGSVTSGAFATSGTSATSSSSADVSTISIFGGDVTATTVAAKAKASANPGNSASDSNGSTVTGLVVLGQPVVPGPGTKIPLGDWGYVVTLQQGTTSLNDSVSKGSRAFVTALDVHLTADHNGIRAGTEVMVGYAEASAKADVLPNPAPRKPVHGQPRKATKVRKLVHGPGIGPERPGLIHRLPTAVTPQLTAGGYVFPVYGPSSFSDTFGAFRGDVPSGWHHGDDIFAPLGAPLLAVASGTVFSVGWNNVGGYRLWLRDHQGNEFYYAHLSAYSPFAVNGHEVKAGTVLGFVGNTGDAVTTPYHLHFEIHPVGLLYLGYDGAVNPTSYLTAWKHLQDIAFAQVAGWAPPVAPTSSAPKPGAILLSSSDISSADGLDPGSLARALKQAGGR